MCSSRNVTNLVVILSSPQSTAPFSVVPKVIAFLWTVTNWRLSLCNSESVILCGGSVMCGLSVVEMVDKLSWPPVPVCSAKMAETIAAVVCSSVCRASVGALAT